MTVMSRWFLVGLLALCTPLAWADPSPPAPSITEPSVILNSQINSGDTAWMLASMALVLMMTVPGLAPLLRRNGAPEETCWRR